VTLRKRGCWLLVRWPAAALAPAAAAVPRIKAGGALAAIEVEAAALPATAAAAAAALSSPGVVAAAASAR